MLTVTRVVSGLYAGAYAACLYLIPDAVKVTAIFGSITAVSSLIANALPDGNVVDAFFSGLAINVTAKTTVAPK